MVIGLQQHLVALLDLGVAGMYCWGWRSMLWPISEYPTVHQLFLS